MLFLEHNDLSLKSTILPELQAETGNKKIN